MYTQNGDVYIYGSINVNAHHETIRFNRFTMGRAARGFIIGIIIEIAANIRPKMWKPACLKFGTDQNGRQRRNSVSV